MPLEASAEYAIMRDMPLALLVTSTNRSEAKKQDFLPMLKMMHAGNHRSTASTYNINRCSLGERSFAASDLQDFLEGDFAAIWL